MKVLQVINSLGTGGAEKLLLDTIPMFNEKGIEMDLLVLWNNNHPFLEELKRTSSCKIFILNENKNINNIYKFSNILKLIKYIADYDVVHVHLFPAQYFVVIANFLSKRKAKLIFTEHSTFNKRMSNFILKYVDKLFYNFYENIVAISKDVYIILEKHIPNQKEKILLIENGVNLTKINKAQIITKNEIHPNLKSEDIILCQVSAFREGKDQLTLVKSLNFLSDNFKIILVGDGDEKEKNKIINYIHQNNLEKRVFFLGIKTNVFNIIKSVDINILSTRFEGLSLASIEGMGSGKPFVASNVEGIKEIVDGAGILFEYQNEKQLAKIILELIEDKEFENNTIFNCLNRAHKYDISKMIEKHIKLYKEIYEN